VELWGDETKKPRTNDGLVSNNHWGFSVTTEEELGISTTKRGGVEYIQEQFKIGIVV